MEDVVMTTEEKNNVTKYIKIAVAGILVAGSLFAGVWAADERWTLNKIYMAGMENINRQTIKIQQNFLIISAEQEVRLKQYKLEQAKKEWERNPNDPVLREKMQSAERDKCAAEQRWFELKTGK